MSENFNSTQGLWERHSPVGWENEAGYMDIDYCAWFGIKPQQTMGSWELSDYDRDEMIDFLIFAELVL